MIGNAIYKPKGKAGEYAKYAVNFYVGCSNDCDYCYCKRGVLGHAMGAPEAKLKKCFKDYMHATDVFRRELEDNLEELRKHGLFFTFSSDPCLDETWFLTWTSVDWAVSKGVPCKILTKRADFLTKHKLPPQWKRPEFYKKIAWGFTLTGHDELERGASTNAERIETMRTLHEMGFKTFASIEPVISLRASRQMIRMTLDFCDLYKIGLLSGKKMYEPWQVIAWKDSIDQMIKYENADGKSIKLYWKDSVYDYMKLPREDDKEAFHVGADYNLFAE